MPSTLIKKIRKPRKADSRRGFTAAEFFAGIGLVRLALESEDWRVVFANDIDPDKQEMYEANFGSKHFKLGDIHKLNVEEIPTCDLFTASFPCNDLSVAGAMKGLNGKQSGAFFGFTKLLKDLGERRPPLVMLENVVGFLMSHGGRDFETAMLTMNKLGYTVDAFILNAVHWVPQSRARLFVVAKRDNGYKREEFAMLSEARPEILFDFISTHPEIRWDIRQLPQLPVLKKRLPDILEGLPKDDSYWWNGKRASRFMAQLSKRHKKKAKEMVQGKMPSYATAFRRMRNEKSMAELRFDGIAGCLRTPLGGSARQILFKAGGGKYQVRLLTARECARLQGTPESYPIEVKLNKALYGFGDAVCVPVVEWIAKHYLSPVMKSMRAKSR